MIGPGAGRASARAPRRSLRPCHCAARHRGTVLGPVTAGPAAAAGGKPVILAPPARPGPSESPDARRVLARRTGRPQRPAALGRAGPFRFRKELYRSSRNGTRPGLPVGPTSTSTVAPGPTPSPSPTRPGGVGVTREERVFFPGRSEPNCRSERAGPPNCGRPLRPPGCTGPP
jgi:hypothetical protein